MRMARELQGSSMARAMQELQNSSAMQMARELQGSSIMRAVQELQNSSAMQMAQEIDDTPIMRALRGLELSSLMPALSRLTGTPFNPDLINQAVTLAHYAGQRGQPSQEDLPKELAAVEAELNGLGDGSLDFTSLSENARSALLWLLLYLVLPFLMSLASGVALERFNERAAVSENVSTPREAKRLARCNDGLEKDIFAGCRVVTGSRLRLRDGASMKAQVITNLPLGKLIVVLDSYERAWLHVEVEIDDNLIQGWVARRYTTHFR